MFLFGHLGIGSKLASPWSKGLPRRALLLGTILPDLIDKPIYYGLSAAMGLHGVELARDTGGIVAGTRLFGHTALFLFTLLFVALWRRSRVVAALAIGVATHLLLDNVLDGLLHDTSRSAFVAMVWPWYGWQFPAIPFHGLGEHLSRAFEPHILGAEIVGMGILAWDYWKSKNRRLVKRARRRRTNRY